MLKKRGAPFSGLVHSAGELLVVTHALADFDFHDHRPDKMNSHPSCYWTIFSWKSSRFATGTEKTNAVVCILGGISQLQRVLCTGSCIRQGTMSLETWVEVFPKAGLCSIRGGINWEFFALPFAAQKTKATPSHSDTTWIRGLWGIQSLRTCRDTHSR